MRLGVAKESSIGETRVAMTPETIKKIKKLGLTVVVEKGAGENAGFRDSQYQEQGAEIAGAAMVLSSDLVVKIQPPSASEIQQLKKNSWLIAMLAPYATDFSVFAQAQINTIAMELVPRTSRAQSMDVLSSQANIAGYRAVLEAAVHYPRFFPMMMTSAGMARPAKLLVLGVGVAGLQAIATARRLGASVEAFDVRPEVKEQILSLGAKYVEIELGESGTGSGGYAKELSAEAKARQQAQLTEKIKKCEVIITTANVPGRKAPLLITEEAVRGMAPGSVIVDMAAPSGGNCALTEPGKIVEKFGVKIIGTHNFAALLPGNSSQFFGTNVAALLKLFIKNKNEFVVDFSDDIIDATVTTYNQEVRFKRK